jgi:AbrB family looped-hinge helix DNA binding protein
MSMISIDADGRILLPKEIRTQLDLNAGDKLLVYNHKDGIIILEKFNKRICFEKWVGR